MSIVSQSAQLKITNSLHMNINERKEEQQVKENDFDIFGTKKNTNINIIKIKVNGNF